MNSFLKNSQNYNMGPTIILFLNIFLILIFIFSFKP